MHQIMSVRRYLASPMMIGPLAIVLANVFFMGSFSLAKVNAAQTSIVVIMLFRFCAGPVWLAPYIAIKKPPMAMASWRLMAVRVACGILAMSALFSAFKYGDISKSTLIFELSIIWTLVIDAWRAKQLPNAWTLGAIALAMVGMGLMVNPAHLITFYSGDAYALLGSFFNAGVYLTLKQLRDVYSTVTVVFWAYAASALVMLGPALPHLPALDRPTIGLLVVMCSLGLVGQLLITLGFKHAPASVSAMFMLSIVPLTTASGMLFFNEVHTWPTIVGMVMVTSALFVIALCRR